MSVREKTSAELNEQLTRAQQEAARLGVPLSVPQESEPFLQNEEWLRTRHPREYYYYRLLLGADREVGHGGRTQKLERYAQVVRSLSQYLESYENEDSTDRRTETQLRVFRKIYEDLARGIESGYVRLPTGTGKTVIFGRVVEALRGRTLVVVPKNTLVEQTGKHFADINKRILASEGEPLEFGVVNEDSKEFDAPIIITTYDSLVAHVESGRIEPSVFENLILDEAHFGLSDKRQEIIDRFSGSIRLGFTATPKFNENKHVGNLLDHEFYSMEVAEAVRSGLLCGATTSIQRTRMDLSDADFTEGKGYASAALDTPSRNQLALDYYRKRNPKTEGDSLPEKAVVFTADIEHARHVAELFSTDGVAAEAISGKETPKQRKAILERFASGETRVLANAQLLIEGFDDAQVSLCLNLKPTTSVVAAEQRGGRVLRIDNDNPGKIAHIVDFVDEDRDIKRRPVLYYEILGSAACFPEDQRESAERRTAPSGETEEREEVDDAIISSEEEFIDYFNLLHKNVDIAPRGWLEYGRAVEEVARQVSAMTVPAEEADGGSLVMAHIAGEAELRRWFREEAERIALSSNERFAGDFFGALGSRGRTAARRTFISPEGMRQLVTPDSVERCRAAFIEEWRNEKLEEKRTDVTRLMRRVDGQLERILSQIRSYDAAVKPSDPIDVRGMEAYHEIVISLDRRIEDAQLEVARLESLGREFGMSEEKAGVLTRGPDRRLRLARELLRSFSVTLDSMKIMDGWMRRDDALRELETRLGADRIDVSQTMNRLVKQERWNDHIADWPDGKKRISSELLEAVEVALLRARKEL